MKEPTKTEAKEFWEKCGFTVYEKDGGMVWWNYPDGSYKGLRLPSINLNNLFKYAVPIAVNNLENRFDAKVNLVRGLEILFARWINKVDEGYSLEDALYEVIKKAFDERTG